MQLFELQHYENHVAKKYADTNNNRLSQASLMIYHISYKSRVENHNLGVVNYFRGGLYLKF